ncbi:MAG: leucine-rich repeat domain-containing protein [Chloroflexota bacterium]|nr:leucine-rich repeat domain-containing protein [Chloroflexota bacterium]MDE2959090.1 leucine-rich repeat domain-containing protein [Chloroflexota bacterium]
MTLSVTPAKAGVQEPKSSRIPDGTTDFASWVPALAGTRNISDPDGDALTGTASTPDNRGNLLDLPEIRGELRALTVSTPETNRLANMCNQVIPVLEDSQIGSLPAGVFSGSANLRFIGVRNNNLIVLPENVFDGLVNLRELNLRVRHCLQQGDAVIQNRTRSGR